jgi:hypothetical protein
MAEQMRYTVLDKTMPSRLDEKGSTFLGIPTGISGRSFSITKLVSPDKSAGWIVRDGEVSDWKVTNIIQRDNTTFVYGKYVEAVSLEALFDEGLPRQLSALKALAAAFSVLRQRNIDLSYVATNSILFPADGGVFILPPVLMREIVNFFGQEEKCLVSEAANHPDLKDEKKLSYFLGSIMYRVATGEYPFSGNTEEDLRYEIRNRTPIAPLYKKPGVIKEVSAFIMAALGKEPGEAPSLNDWEKELDLWQKNGIERPVAEADAQKIILEGKAKEEKGSKNIKRKIFWEKNAVRFLTITGVSILVVAILWTTLGNTVFRTRKTRGFSPLKVVETYYSCFNSLDVVTIEDCVIGNAGKADVDTVVNLYVMSKPATPYDNSFHYVTASDWDKNGRPDLDKNSSLYGITVPHISQIESEPTPVFDVTYERWYSEKDPKTPEWQLSMIISGMSIEDKLYLKLSGKKDWVIYKIDRLKDVALEHK